MASMTREEVAALLGGDRLYSAGRDRLYTVDEAMRAYVAASVADGRDVAGVMGGSSTPRDAPAYRLAAQTAKALSEAGFLVATGGGLGIMEAGNLGAYFAGRPDDELRGDLPGPRPERRRRAGAAGGDALRRHRRLRPARIAVPPRPSRAGRAAAPFDDLVTLADSPEAVVAEMRVSRRRTGYEADEQ